MARLAKFTPEACAEALSKFIEQEFGLKPLESRIVYRANCIFIEMQNFEQIDDDQEVPDYLITLLDNRTLPDGTWIPVTEVITCYIYDCNPMPKIENYVTHRTIQTPLPFSLVTFVSTETHIESRACKLVDGSWGERRQWPFE